MGGLDGTKARGEAEGEAFYKPLSLSIHSFSFLSKAVQLWRFRGLNVQKKIPWILWLHAFSIVSESRSVMSDSWQPHGLYSPWNSPDQNTGVGSLSLLQGIFPTQGSNPGLPHYRWILSQLNHQGSPRILEWVAFPFSRGSSQPRDLTQVSRVAGRFFTSWPTREAQEYWNGSW